MINPMRHQEYFQPHDYGDKRVDVVGVGATGSKIAMSLARLGVQNIHVWDDDTIESHNIANQNFNLSDIGEMKGSSIKEHIENATGTIIEVHNVRLGATPEPLGEVVFNLVDTMSARKEIWESSVKLKPLTKLMIETRMGPDNGRVYAVNPIASKDIKGWEGTLYSDDVTPVSACGATSTIGSTGDMISGFAVWNFMRFAAGKDIPNEIIFSIEPMLLLTQDFAG